MTRSTAMVLMVAFLAGCGTCGQVTAHRDAFREAALAEPPDSLPHVALEIPDALIDDWTKAALGKLPDLPFNLPGLDAVQRYIGRFEFKARSLRVELQRDQAARFDLDLDVRQSGRTLFGMQLGAVAPVQYDKKNNQLRVALRADMFEKIAPRIDTNAVSQLTSAIQRQVGIPLPGGVIEGAARQGIEALSRQAYSLVRQGLLTPLGELGSFKFGLPDLPISGLALTTTRGGWRVEARTPLAAPGLARMADAPSGRTIRMAISAPVLARLGNWAMDKGKLPARFDRTGKAQDDGDFEAGLQWNNGERPLKVNLWTIKPVQSSICMAAMVGAEPKVAFQKGQLSVGFEDGKIEEVIGPPLFSNALDIMGITEKTFDFSKKIATKTRLQFGSKAVGVEVAGIALDGQALTIDLEAGGGG